VALGPLGTDQGLELLSRVLGADRVEAEAKAALRLIDLCAGLPLALRIAMLRLSARPYWRIRDLANRLADPVTRLDELVAGSLSLRGSLAMSYARLPAGPIGSTPARAFRLLGLWSGPDISLAAAAALLNTDTATAEDILEGLVDQHLLEAADGPRRYRFPNLVGLYAAERAREEECPTEIRAAMSRLLSWYVHSAGAAGQVITPNTRPILDGWPPEGIRPWTPPDPRQAIGWLNSELPNLRAAAREAAMRKDNQTASMIAAALRTFHERSTPPAKSIMT
jgi:hypothetical protein